MKRLTWLAAVSLAALLAVASGPATADVHLFFGYGVDLGHEHARHQHHLGLGHPDRFVRPGHFHRGHRHRRYRPVGGHYRPGPPPRGRYFSRRGFRRPQRCEPVSKRAYDRFGRSVRIGGMLCYGRRGPYIVPGSRFFIGYD